MECACEEDMEDIIPSANVDIVKVEEIDEYLLQLEAK